MKRERKYKPALWTTLPGAKVTPPKVRHRIRQKSKRQSQRDRRYKPIRDAFLIEHPFCQVCLHMSTVGFLNYDIERASEVHHKKGKIGELLFDTRFFLATCREHHNQIGDQPAWAKAQGFIVDRYGI